jgi:hypothetical protein
MDSTAKGNNHNKKYNPEKIPYNRAAKALVCSPALMTAPRAARKSSSTSHTTY